MSAILLQIVQNQNLVKRFRREQTYSNLHENSTPTKFFIKTFDRRHALSLVSDCGGPNFERKSYSNPYSVKLVDAHTCPYPDRADPNKPTITTHNITYIIHNTYNIQHTAYSFIHYYHFQKQARNDTTTLEFRLLILYLYTRSEWQEAA